MSANYALPSSMHKQFVHHYKHKFSHKPQSEQSDCGFFIPNFMQTNNHSAAVKSEIVASLLKEPRFQIILQKVAEAFQKGQDPVVIESWNTYWKRFAPTDKMWHKFVPEESYVVFQDSLLHRHAHMDCRATLNVQLPQPFREAIVTICVTEDNLRKLVVKCATKVPNEMMTELVSWGYRDKNYFKYFFRALGYGVSEGTIANKHGLLITLEE